MYLNYLFNLRFGVRIIILKHDSASCVINVEGITWNVVLEMIYYTHPQPYIRCHLKASPPSKSTIYKTK